MHLKTWIPVVLLATALAVSGCGGPSSAKGQTIGAGAATLPVEKLETDIATLVPENTDVLLYVPSTDVLMAKAKKMVAVFGEKAEKGFDPQDAIRELTGSLYEQFDPSKAMAVAISMPADPEGRPAFTMILPMKDVQAALKVFEEQGQEAPHTKGSYVVMSMGPPAKVPEKVPAIAKHVPKGDLVLRADVAKLVELFGEDAMKGLQQGIDKAGANTPPGGPDIGKLASGMQQMVQDLMDSAEFFDLAVTMEDTDLHLQGLFTMKEGSKLANIPAASGDLVSMAGALPGEFPIVALASIDFQKMMTWMEPFMDTAFEIMPEEDRATMMEQWKSAMALYDHVGDKSAMGFRMDEAGMVMAMVMELTDSKKFFEEWEALMTGDYVKMLAGMGVEFERLPRSKVAGYDVEHFVMAFDTEKMLANNPDLADAPPEAAEAARKMIDGMFGADGWKMHIADVNGRMVSVVGGDAALLEQAIQNAAAGAGPQAGALKAAIEKAGGKPSYLLYIEGRSLMQGVMRMMRDILPPEQAEKMPTVPDGKPLNILFHATGDGRYYAGGFSMDFGALKDIIESFKTQMR